MNIVQCLDNFFKIKQNGSSFKNEIIGALTTFMTMAYIIFVNPSILSKTGMDPSAVMMATVLSASFGCFLMGLIANYPFALAPGMGLNAYFTYTVVLQMGYPWCAALGAVFISSLLFFLLTLVRLRQLLVKGIPECLKQSFSIGIGLFITLIGLQEAGLIVKNDNTLLALGDLTKLSTLLSICGLIIIGSLIVKRIHGAILIGIVAVWITSIIFGLTEFKGLIGKPPSIAPTFLKLDIKQAIDLGFFVIVFVFLYVDLFDATGTFIGVAKQGDFMKNGDLPRLGRALCVDAVTAMLGALLGTSTTTVYVESTTGIVAGARTGFSAIIVGLLFLLSMFIAPIAASIPTFATAPALIIVGVYMTRSIVHIKWDDFTESLPAFLVMVFMPFTYSIATGIVMGVIVYPLIKLFTGKYKDVSIVMWVLAAIFIFRFIYIGVVGGFSN